MILDSDIHQALHREKLAIQRAEAAERERDELAAQLEEAQNALKAIIADSTYIDDCVNDAGDKQISRLYTIADDAMLANQVQP